MTDRVDFAALTDRAMAQSGRGHMRPVIEEAAVLLRQISLKFGPPREEVGARIEAADADTLLDWSARILTAERADDIFR